MKDIESFCQYFYRDALIPVYIYKNHNWVTSIPTQSPITRPPAIYLETLWQQTSPVSYITTSFHSFFGCIRFKEDPSIQFVIGPVSNVPYSEEVLRMMHREYFVSPNERKGFYAFFSNISTMTLKSFLNKLLFFQYALNQTPLLLPNIIDTNLSQTLCSIANEQAETMYRDKENGSFNNSYEIEQKLTSLIENGNVEEFKNYASDISNIHEGIIASNPIRQAKNTSIVMITLATRAAIRGGLPKDTAFQLSDLYIQKTEQLTTMESIYQLNYNALYDFTCRVSESQIPVASDDAIQKAIHYVLENTNVRLTVSDVASYLGFSRSYFSHRFKQTLGFDLSAFIVRCKLEESKYLLAYTEKSISEISNYLCFSSQSHFQTVFKKQYGTTPYDYRKNPQTLQKRHLIR